MSERRQSGAPEPGAPEREHADEPFLKRWSRLKSDRAAAATAPPATAPEASAPAAHEDAVPEAEAEPLPPGDEDMPPLESLDENSDFSGFMSPRVSAALRKQALRKLFRSPKFNVISELDDYIDDYRSFPALGDVITSDMQHAAARLLEKHLGTGEDGAAAAGAAAGGADPDADPTAAGDEAAGAGAKPVAADAEVADEQHAPADDADDIDTSPDQHHRKEPTRDA